jgi:hypothetical protein
MLINTITSIKAQSRSGNINWALVKEEMKGWRSILQYKSRWNVIEPQLSGKLLNREWLKEEVIKGIESSILMY